MSSRVGSKSVWGELLFVVVVVGDGLVTNFAFLLSSGWELVVAVREDGRGHWGRVGHG